jgi:hypothetical protein
MITALPAGPDPADPLISNDWKFRGATFPVIGNPAPGVRTSGVETKDP